MKWSFLISFSLSLAGGVIIYLLESEMLEIPDSYLASFDHGTLRQRKEMALNILVPQLTFFSKFGIQLAFCSTYQASFSDESLFPAEKRATSIGQC